MEMNNARGPVVKDRLLVREEERAMERWGQTLRDAGTEEGLMKPWGLGGPCAGAGTGRLGQGMQRLVAGCQT